MQSILLMWKNISITSRITLAFALLVILMGSAIATLIMVRTSATLTEAETRELEHAFTTLEATVKDQGQHSEALSSMIAVMPSVQDDMARGDREALRKAMDPIWSIMKGKYAAKQFQFHTPPATSFLRLHKQEKFGDDLSSFRKTVLLANADHRAVSGIEKGVAGLGIRGVVPISKDDKHLGTVEFGLSFGQEFFDHFKKRYGLDVALYLRDGYIFKPFASTFTSTSILDDADLNEVFAGNPILLHHDIENTSVAIYARAIADFSGNNIGVIEIAMDRSAYVESVLHTQYVVFGIMAGVMIIGLILAAWISHGVTKPVNNAVSVANRIAQGELDNEIEITRSDEIGELLTSLKTMNTKLLSIVDEVRTSSDSVGSTAKQIYFGNSDLSRRTQEQAGALEETAASMEEMTATVKNNADNANQAYQLVAETRDRAEKGGTVVGNAVIAMKEINVSSKKISEIISVIDEIAFQTNLLALNAAVEAARAGEHGRGFAVVASEVRNLAQRSVSAAKEIKHLITNSVEKIETGSVLVNESGETLTEIVDSVKKVTEFVAEIAAASREQYTGIEQVNKAMIQIDKVTQQNAALVEEAASASQSMERQASHMIDLVRFFKTGKQNDAYATTESIPKQIKQEPMAPHYKTKHTTPPVSTPEAEPNNEDDESSEF